MRAAWIALFVGVFATAAVWWILGGKEATPEAKAPAAKEAPRTRRSIQRTSGAPRPADGEGSADLAPTDAAEFDLFPPAHRPDAINAALDDMPEWLGSGYADATPELLGVDCAAPPCMVGLRYEDDGLDAERLAAFVQGYRVEVERRVGFRMTVTDMQEDRSGRQYIWMYAIPDEITAEDGIREDLLDEAAERNGKRMTPLMAEPTPAEPQSGEPIPG